MAHLPAKESEAENARGQGTAYRVVAEIAKGLNQHAAAVLAGVPQVAQEGRVGRHAASKHWSVARHSGVAV